jgi:hypothetical protein
MSRHSYNLRVGPEPNDVVHIDTDGPCTDEELEVLTEYFKLFTYDPTPKDELPDEGE